ncbi:MAG: hypothetical protein PVH12_02535 [Candidatus Bathyarchaeota archaeon]|jgi:exonuclease SbcC
MILNQLLLKNIRSYKEETVKFPQGTILFEGDVGSGKTTILMAIEFALFGLGSEKGGALLRTGSKEGSVILQFEVDGEDYEVYRSLVRKGRRVGQAKGHIKTSEGVLELSASEMKEKVLDILNFNEPSDPKAQSVIYRYAVFTPQEEMKAILWMRPDSRLQTLRKAFRIEGYRTASDNASNTNKTIKNQRIKLETLASNIEKKKEEKRKRTAKVEASQKTLDEKTKAKKPLETQLKVKKEELRELREKKEDLGKIAGQVPLLTQKITESKERKDELEVENEKLQWDNTKLEPTINELEAFKKPTDKTLKELEEEQEKMRTMENDLRKRQGSIEQKIDDYRAIQVNEVCPTCDRPADPKEYGYKVGEKEEERASLIADTKRVKARIQELRRLQAGLRDFKEAETKLKMLKDQVLRNRKSVEKNEKTIKELAQSMQEATGKLEAAKKEIEQIEQLDKEAKRVDKEISTLDGKINRLGNEISSLQTEIEIHKQEIKRLAVEIADKENQKIQAKELGEYQIWIDDFFIPTTEIIEKHVMLNISQEFNQQFQKWFSLLIEDPSKDARIDEEFTPIIEQDGYEQNILYLSGGEKTSLALAYRLALNNIVQKVSTGMKSNLLILDEPTDGFSKDQLFKIREILNEIKCPQVIIVSHEKELESFADQIWKVTKTEGISSIV